MNKIKNFLIKREQSQARLSFAKREKSRLLAKTILTLVALIAVTTGAWAETGENIFQYCYDCQRNPDYPKTTASATLDGFENPLVGYKGSGFGMDNTPAGPWKLEYVGLWSTTNQYGIGDIWNYQDTYNCTDVPVFRLYQWNATANEYQHAAYGVVCCYAKVSNAVEHTALFVSEDGWGCVLTNSSHTSSMNITFDEDLSTGLATLIAAATPAASGTPVAIDWTAASKTGTFKMPGGNVELEPEYFAVAEFTDGGTPTGIADIKATTDDDIVKAGTVKNIGSSTTPQGTVMYYAVQSATAPTAPDYDATGWTDKVPTATDFAEGNVYVWYYIKGAEPASGTDRTDANTCSDSEITALGTTGYVTLLAAPKYNAEFAFDEGTPDAEKAKWTASPNANVTKGQTVTVTYTGSKKVLGVKAEKKAAAGPTVANATTSDIGKVVCAAGHLHDAKTAVPTGCTAVAIFAYIDGGNNRIAIALQDGEAATWYTLTTDGANNNTLCSVPGTWTVTAPTDAEWFVGTKAIYEAIFTNLGSTTGDSDGKTYDDNVNAYITTVGGKALSGGYWSTSEKSESIGWDFGSGYWYNDYKTYGLKVRPVLAW